MQKCHFFKEFQTKYGSYSYKLCLNNKKIKTKLIFLTQFVCFLLPTCSGHVVVRLCRSIYILFSACAWCMYLWLVQCGSVNCSLFYSSFFSLIFTIHLWVCNHVLCLCMCVRVCLVSFQRDDCLFFLSILEVKITKNKNDSIQVFFSLFVCFNSFKLT